MPDGSVIESPRVRPVGGNESRDALLRLPIQPNEAHLLAESLSPSSSVVPGDSLGISSGVPPRTRSRSRAKTQTDLSRWMTFPAEERGDDYFRGRPDTVIVLPWSQVIVVASGDRARG